MLRAIEPEAPPLAWAKQIHSAVALPARPGHCGEGDALFTDEPGLVLSVITADCVPVLVAGPEGLAAIHAGWRGIVGGVIPAALEKMKGAPADWTAWVGPAIGACCYEVGEDVAGPVVAASGPGIADPRSGRKTPPGPPRSRPAPARKGRRGPGGRPAPLHPLRRGEALELPPGGEGGGTGYRVHLAAGGGLAPRSTLLTPRGASLASRRASLAPRIPGLRRGLHR